MDDPTLIRGTLDGRLEDFATLVERYQRMLYAFVLRETADPAVADEVVQTSFFRAWEALPGFRFEASFRSWLHEIALDECRSRRRARRRRAEVPLGDVVEEDLPVADDEDPASRRLRSELGREIERLPPRQRAVLALRIFSDLPFREIARIEGISVGAAKVSYHHAVKRLKKWLR